MKSIKSEGITYKKLWGTAKATVRGKFIAIKTYINRKNQKSQINALKFHIRHWEKKSKVNLKQVERKK